MEDSHRFVQIAVALPGYCVIAFCCYSLAVIGVNLFTFPECPKAADELLIDLQRAKDGLASRRFRVPDA
jgi:Dolichol-phosphate mannosyltransferase subunit 3 (DPM3)